MHSRMGWRAQFGVTVEITTPTLTPVTITANLTYDTRDIDSGTLLARSRDALNAHIATLGELGGPVTRGALIDALFVDGAIDVILTSPAASIAPVIGRAHTFADSDITLTATAV